MDIVRFSYYMFIILLILTIIRTEPNLRNYNQTHALVLSTNV